VRRNRCPRREKWRNLNQKIRINPMTSSSKPRYPLHVLIIDFNQPTNLSPRRVPFFDAFFLFQFCRFCVCLVFVEYWLIDYTLCSNESKTLGFGCPFYIHRFSCDCKYWTQVKLLF
jgi:hypothetical protein